MTDAATVPEQVSETTATVPATTPRLAQRMLRPGMTPWQPGKSGNPSGRTGNPWKAFMREKSGANTNEVRMRTVMNAMFLTAIDRRHRDHAKMAELICLYTIGRPVQAVQVSGSINTPVTLDLSRFTLEQAMDLRRQIALAEMAQQGDDDKDVLEMLEPPGGP